MKVKCRLGIQSYSGQADGLIYANFASRGVVIAKMPSVGREATEQNHLIANRSQMISTIYKNVSLAYKQDLELYTYKMYNLEEYQERISGNKYSTFCKLIWAACQQEENPLDLESLITNGLTLENCSQIKSLKVVVENGFLPEVNGFEELLAEIVDDKI